MINYELPTQVNIDGTSYHINRDGDYRMILDVIAALNDDSLSEQEKGYCALCIFYDFNIPDNAQKAIDKMVIFLNAGEESKPDNKPPIMSWVQDFPLIVAPINKVLGCEVRAVKYMHWWTFVSGYMEIGECSFSNIVNIRNKKRRGLKLDKQEQEFYNENREKVDLKCTLNKEEQNFINNILGINENFG